ncbi:unnamed protein product [Blepharisma stoltei]|uniref:Uncharacterized protein n=1 Tax=Blepharisma stoltei TaxID=1481888 RepID=A0AAU9KCY1_9CILI|nr:unnamed protein product [Blepharisma stoltei]
MKHQKIYKNHCKTQNYWQMEAGLCKPRKWIWLNHRWSYNNNRNQPWIRYFNTRLLKTLIEELIFSILLLEDERDIKAILDSKMPNNYSPT